MTIAGATVSAEGFCTFTVWAPLKKKMVLHITHPQQQKIEMRQDEDGYFQATAPNITHHTKYFFRPDDENDYPDPASQYQPEGVHGPSMVINDAHFKWTDAAWKGIPFKDLVLYELHVGTFSPEGTFDGIVSRLDHFVETGINAIELLPLAQFPGSRNWGYDGVFPYAVQNSYGGPEGLKKLVDACHQKGIAVFVDVVYNHIGPEGNYFEKFGPYFTEKYQTPWGNAINYDGEWSDGVRDYFSQNALHWFEHYHVDGLRLDAIHMAFDNGAVNFWEYVNTQVKELQHKLGRPLYMIAESDLNAPKVVRSPENGGLGFDAQWLDDFHHALYVVLNKNDQERYADFSRVEQLAKAFTDGFVHAGEFVKFRKRKHGASSAGIAGDRFVVFNQNHDQVGNRVLGERLCQLVDFERVKLGAAAVLLSPYVPMLFMGEEYADKSPFFYFVSHSEPALIKAVQEGRKKEFEAFKWDVDPPDPQSEKTFNDSKLKWERRNEGGHQIILQWHKALIGLRNTNPILKNYNKNDVRADVLKQDLLVLKRQSTNGIQHLLCIFNFSDETHQYELPPWANQWNKILDSREQQWMKDDGQRSSIVPVLKPAQTIDILPCSITVFEGTLN